MNGKFHVIILALIMVGFLGGTSSAQVAPASERCSSIERIYVSMDACDGRNVTLTGKVTRLVLAVSEKGNEYTTFMLDDDTTTPLKVFSYTYLPISEGGIVKVTGTFYKVYTKSDYTFPIIYC